MVRAHALSLAAILTGLFACDEAELAEEMMASNDAPPAENDAPPAEGAEPEWSTSTLTEKAEQPEGAYARRTARQLMSEATSVLEIMRRDATLDRLLRQSKGVFIAPGYAPSRSGVLVARTPAGWDEPRFYEVAGIGAARNQYEEDIAVLAMSDAALEVFNEGVSPHSADLKLIDYVGLRVVGLSNAKDHDIVFWSEDANVFTDVDLGLVGVSPDHQKNATYRNDKAAAKTPDARFHAPEASLERALSYRQR